MSMHHVSAGTPRNRTSGVSKSYKDVSREWLSDQRPRQAIPENRDTVVGNDGRIYHRGDEGVDITLEPKSEDREAAEWWKSIKGGDIRLNPRLNKPENVKNGRSADRRRTG